MDIFILRGAGCKPELKIIPKIDLLIFTPHLLIPLPQGARKAGEREWIFSSFVVLAQARMEDYLENHSLTLPLPKLIFTHKSPLEIAENVYSTP
jgi:hypothetical protein